MEKVQFAILVGVLQVLIATAKKPPRRLSLLHPTKLVVEIPKLEACPLPGNSVHFYNIQFGVQNKHDFFMNLDFNITRSIADYPEIVLEITKCRESETSNNCEPYHTWRFDKEACRAFNDPLAVWKSAIDSVSPRPDCPSRKGHYEMRNASISSGVLSAVPMPWEGNVWLLRFLMLQPGGRVHICCDVEVRVHRVRAR